MMNEKLFVKEIEINEVDLNRMYLHIASSSLNPAVIDAIQNLVVLLKLSEQEAILKDIEFMKTFTEIAKNRLAQFSADECHDLIDEVLQRGDNNSIFALENFIDVARQNKNLKKKRR